MTRDFVRGVSVEVVSIPFLEFQAGVYKQLFDMLAFRPRTERLVFAMRSAA